MPQFMNKQSELNKHILKTYNRLCLTKTNNPKILNLLSRNNKVKNKKRKNSKFFKLKFNNKLIIN